MTISTPIVAYIVNVQGPNILINLSAIDIIAGIFSIFYKVIKPLIA
jgi:hypothetical protein